MKAILTAKEIMSKLNYEIYNKSLHQCLDQVSQYCKRNEIVSSEYEENEWWQPVGYGETSRHSFNIDSIKGKNTKKALSFQIFRLESGNYELNLYHA